ncbi:MAG: HypC/HybG/HupF family hydrogenase formation chaperone [Anaerolineales bacterium]
MCLSVPGKIETVYEEGALKMGKVNFGGIVKEICLDYVPEAQAGEYVLVHVGFAISVIDDEEAQARLETIRELGNLEEELDGA